MTGLGLAAGDAAADEAPIRFPSVTKNKPASARLASTCRFGHPRKVLVNIMNVSAMMYPFLLVFPFLMIYSAFSDLLTMTIPNRVSLILLAGFPVLAFAAGVPLEAIGWHLSCGIGILVITFTLFSFGWIGGGDAKLAAATALWLGWDHMLDYGLISSVLGGALTLAMLQMRKFALPEKMKAQAWIERLHNGANGVPYGIALAVAGLILYPETRIWLGATLHG